MPELSPFETKHRKVWILIFFLMDPFSLFDQKVYFHKMTPRQLLQLLYRYSGTPSATSVCPVTPSATIATLPDPASLITYSV